MQDLDVIIPVFNAGRFLGDCLRSVCGQTFGDIGIICVDDGSTDDSASILEAFHDRDPRVMVLSQGNKGLSAARNHALDASSARYVTFVDADDTIAPEAYSVMMDWAVEMDLDAVGCCFRTFPDGRESSFDFRTGDVMGFGDLLGTSRKVESSNDLCLCWRYMFRREVIEENGIRFREDIRFAEDMVFVTEVLAHCKRIYLSDKAFYNYRIGNPESLMGNRRDPERLNAIPLGYAAKLAQIERFGMDRWSPCSRDLSEYTIRRYLPMLLDALPIGRDGSVPLSAVRGVLSLPMIRNSCKAIGFRNIHTSWKEYLFYLAVKFRIGIVVKNLWFK
jgi:glycosyltransferase EpsJ